MIENGVFWSTVVYTRSATNKWRDAIVENLPLEDEKTRILLGMGPLEMTGMPSKVEDWMFKEKRVFDRGAPRRLF